MHPGPRICGVLLVALALASPAVDAADAPPVAPADTKIRLLVRADDMGVAKGVNDACIQSFKNGIARSVEVIVPGSWFLDAVQQIKDTPGLDVGVHLCLTSEWERVKWRPLTHAPSLVDADGYFFPMTSQRRDFPPNTGFLNAKPNPDEVEKELRAQIELCRRHLGDRVTHVSAHMGAATATPELKAITEKLCKEYKLRMESGLTRPAGRWSGNTIGAEQKEANLVKLLETLKPGTYLIVEHPGLDTEEMRAMGHKGYENVAADRAGVTRAFTSEKVQQTIKNRGIELIGYQDLPAANPDQARAP